VLGSQGLCGGVEKWQPSLTSPLPTRKPFHFDLGDKNYANKNPHRLRPAATYTRYTRYSLKSNSFPDSVTIAGAVSKVVPLVGYLEGMVGIVTYGRVGLSRLHVRM
jgi:hypothetical protein